jgi:DNA-binding MarR family transcriptional regulator
MNSNIEFGRSISLVYHSYRKFITEQLSKIENLTPGWVPYLKIISQNPGIVSEDLSKRMMVSKPAITKTIRQLELEGLCSLQNHPTDKRSKKLFLTTKAEAVLKEVNPILKTIQNDVLKGLSTEEIEALDGILSKILNNIAK